MRFDVALKKLDGQSVGGQLIVQHEGRNLLVGHHHDGHLIVAEDPEAQKLVAGLTDDPMDRDNDGRMGGSVPRTPGKRGRKKAEPQPPETTHVEASEPGEADEPEDPDEPAHGDVLVSDEPISAGD